VLVVVCDEAIDFAEYYFATALTHSDLRPVFRPAHIRRYVSLMQERGFRAAAVLAGSGIELDKLEDAACLVNLEQCQAVVNNMIRLTGDSGLGFAFGTASTISDIGIVGHAFISA